MDVLEFYEDKAVLIKDISIKEWLCEWIQSTSPWILRGQWTLFGSRWCPELSQYSNHAYITPQYIFLVVR